MMKNTFLKFTAIIAGLAGSFYLLYIRLIKLSYLPQEITYPMDYLKLWIYGVLLFLNIGVMLYILILWCGIITPKESNIHKKYIEPVEKYMEVTFHDLYISIMSKIPNYLRNLRKVGYYIAGKFSVKTLVGGLIIILVLPRLLVCASFLIDVLYFSKFYYFYKCIPLLLISYLVKYVLFVFTDMSINGMKDLLTIFDQEEFQPDPSLDKHIRIMRIHLPGEENENSMACSPYDRNVRLKESFIEENTPEECLKVYSLHYDLTVIGVISTYLKGREIEISVVLNILVRILYIIGWGYMIYYGIISPSSTEVIPQPSSEIISEVPPSEPIDVKPVPVLNATSNSNAFSDRFSSKLWSIPAVGLGLLVCFAVGYYLGPTPPPTGH